MIPDEVTGLNWGGAGEFWRHFKPDSHFSQESSLKNKRLHEKNRTTMSLNQFELNSASDEESSEESATDVNRGK